MNQSTKRTVAIIGLHFPSAAESALRLPLEQAVDTELVAARRRHAGSRVRVHQATTALTVVGEGLLAVVTLVLDIESPPARLSPLDMGRGHS